MIKWEKITTVHEVLTFKHNSDKTFGFRTVCLTGVGKQVRDEQVYMYVQASLVTHSFGTLSAVGMRYHVSYCFLYIIIIAAKKIK